MLLFKKYWAKLTGAKIVILTDFDGEANVRIVRKLGKKWVGNRMGFGVGMFYIDENDNLIAPSYVKSFVWAG